VTPSTGFLADPDARFELMLARDLGLPRWALRRSLSVAEYTDWRALYSLEAKEREEAINRGRRGR
jgi:hypothetical protein